MNCDQVFDMLTRNSFPAAETTDDAVEFHLRACHDCRQLAEALRPAVDLFHESLHPADRRELPAYHGDALATSDQDLPALIDALVERTLRGENGREEPGELPRQARVPASLATQLDSNADTLQVGSPIRAARLCMSRWQQVIGACLATLAVIFLLWSLTAAGTERRMDRLRPTAFGPTSLPESRAAEPRIVAQIKQLKLPEVCLSGARERVASRAACCTNCHAAVIAETPSLTTLVAAWDTCSLCHSALGDCF